MNEAAYRAILKRLGVQPAEAEQEPTRPTPGANSQEPARPYHPDPEISTALGQVDAEIRTGQIKSTLSLVRGKPLADYLTLDELAWWLRRAKP